MLGRNASKICPHPPPPTPPLRFIRRQTISLCFNIFFNFSFAFFSFWRISGSNWIGTLHTLFDFVAIGFYSFFNTFYLMTSKLKPVLILSNFYWFFPFLLHFPQFTFYSCNCCTVYYKAFKRFSGTINMVKLQTISDSKISLL